MLRQALNLVSPGGHRGRLSVLIFHRVLPRVDPLFPTEVDAAYFDAVCSWLKAYFHVLPLDQAVQQLQAGSLPSRAAAITFDDGYADNHQVAMPILRKHGLTATFFVTTGYLDGGMMWNDAVIESIRRTAKPVLAANGIVGVALEELQIGSEAEKGPAIQAVINRIKYLEPEQRKEFTTQLADRLEVVLPTDLMMTSAQVRDMRSNGMLIGAHTVTHPILALLDESQVAREAGESKRFLEELLGERVGLFAYPNGKLGTDYRPEQAGTIRELGFDASFATDWGAANGATDLFRMPRFSPWDRSPYKFSARMAWNLVAN